MEIINPSASFSQHIMAPGRVVPNNLSLAVICYNQVLNLSENDENLVEELFESNGWTNSWVNGIYTYHHYHSNAHEVLAILSGNCMLELGGEDGNIQSLSKGDVIVLPAGVVHKNVGSSNDFSCLGAYADGIDFNINYCKAEEMEQALIDITQVPMPQKDPVLGSKGPLLGVWKGIQTTSDMEETRQF